MNRDTLSGLALLVLAGAYYRAMGAIAESTLSDEVGATGLPRILVIALAGLGVILLMRSLFGVREASASGESGERADEEATLPRAIGFLLLGAAYVILLPYVGYIAGVALLIGAVAVYEGAPRGWTLPVAALGGAIFYWAVFVKLLGVNQPVGAIFQGLLS